MFNLFFVALTVLLCSPFYNAFEIHSRVFNGSTANLGQFPYFVNLQIILLPELRSGPDAFRKCGGALISDEFILTAAHCLNGVDHLIAYLGTVSARPTFKDPGHIAISISSNHLYQHPQYIQGQLPFDIGLIRLPSRVQFTPTIQPVQMPTNKSLDYVEAIVMGNGGNTSPTAQLQFTVTTTYSFTFCKKMLSHVIDWSDAYICAYGQQSALKGDSGAPFVRDNTIIGILSFGAKGARKNHKNRKSTPLGFSSVYFHLEWIRNVTGLRF